MRLLIHDFAGHPFQAELSRELARRGHRVVHGFCGGVATGRGQLARQPGDPSGLRFVDVSRGPFERYSYVRRVQSEVEYGRRLAALIREQQPQVVLSANTPLASQALAWRACERVGARRVYWLQDFLGRGTRAVLARRSAVAGATLGRSWEMLETRLLRQSEHVVAITEDFLPELDARDATAPVAVVPNWTPLDEITLRPKDNEWSRAHGLADRPVALYSGTLGLKHDPEHLVAAAQRLRGGDGMLVVVTEGIGRTRLDERRDELGLDNLLLLDYVDYEVLPDLLGAADVCLVLLEADAGRFSAPSKVLTYLAAGRAIVGAMPAENLATRTIVEADAGIVVQPGRHDSFGREVGRLLGSPGLASRCGARGRAWAEAHFPVGPIADRFESVMAAG